MTNFTALKEKKTMRLKIGAFVNAMNSVLLKLLKILKYKKDKGAHGYYESILKSRNKIFFFKNTL